MPILKIYRRTCTSLHLLVYVRMQMHTQFRNEKKPYYTDKYLYPETKQQLPANYVAFAWKMRGAILK